MTIKKTRFITIIAMCTLASSVLAGKAKHDMEVSVDTVSDRRTTGNSFKGLSVDLKIEGYDLERAVGVLPPQAEKAESDFERSLLKEDDRHAKFFAFSRHDGDVDHTETLELKNPRRKSETFTIKGHVPVVMPTENNNAKIEINDFLKKAGNPIRSSILKNRDIELSYYTKEQFKKRQKEAQEAKKNAEESNKDSAKALAESLGSVFAEALGGMFGTGGAYDINFVIEDPKNQIISIALYDADGGLMDPGMRTASAPDGDAGTAGFDFDQPLPEGGTLKILLEHESNIVRVPFQERVELP